MLFKVLLRNLLRDVRGTSAVEYALICGMVILIMIVALQGVADVTTDMWTDVSDKTQAAIGE
ncbi:Flp family type IVb pilin [Novosphingobium sp. PC22D]|uniref:Flp family type IVb pilin n=1 Tax=Novosphingobium sp. PC22D TaxID=1962403 RepID=UPI000BF0C762|nr:Flp family type IVb pilin [Novosphingobium sp. PC22D]